MDYRVTAEARDSGQIHTLRRARSLKGLALYLRRELPHVADYWEGVTIETKLPGYEAWRELKRSDIRGVSREDARELRAFAAPDRISSR